MIIFGLLNIILAGFLGYVIGRVSDYYINFWINDPNWAPDHWTYGLVLMIVALVFFKGDAELLIFSFGAGVLISDLKDFLHLKFHEQIIK